MIQIMKSGKIRKYGLVSKSRKENLVDLFLLLLARLKHDPNCFTRIPSSNFPEMRALGTF